MDQIITLSLAALRESPFNPRKVYDQAALEELSLSIAAQGLLQPIVVRPAPNRPNEQRNLQITHELVFGHRRVRAAILAELDSLPAIVRDMTDEEAAIAQVHENTQRADVTAIEEADSFAHLTAAHKMKPDDIAVAIGKSRSYVYGRLKMARMAPEVRAAVTSEGLPPEIALEVARLPHHNLQRQALKGLHDHDYVDGQRVVSGWMSYRQAKGSLKHLFDTQLAKAPFDITDSLLAGRAGACTTCPRRAGNCPDLKGVLADDVCTDKACYEIKVDAHVLRRATELRKAGHTVIDGDEAKALMLYSYIETPRGYRLLTQKWTMGTPPEQHTVADMLARMGADAPKTTFVRNPHTDQLVECVTDDELQQILHALWPEGDDDEGASTPSNAARAHAHAHEDRGTPEERALGYPNWEKVAGVIMKRAAARTNRSLEELRWAACALIEAQYDVNDNVLDAMGWREELVALENSDVEDKPSDEADFTFRKLKTATADELATFIVLQAIALAPYGEFNQVEARAQKLAIAAHYGVDVIAAAGLQEQTDDAGDAGERTAQADAFEEAEA
jgi:ParB/RepB/Spo0J family partition protein